MKINYHTTTILHAPTANLIQLKPQLQMREISFLDIILNSNIKLHMKGDQAYTCNLQP